MQTHSLPKAGLLLFSSTYSKGGSRFKYVFRVLTQVFTFSNYDHCATLIQCPMELNGKMITDYKGKVVFNKYGISKPWKGGQYYAFEALNGKGNIVRTLEGFLESLQNPVEKRSVKLDLQEYKKRLDDGSLEMYNPEQNFEKMFLSLASQIGKPYTTFWAGYSAFDKTKLVKWFKKKLKIKPALSEANFCSAYAEIALQDEYEEEKNKAEAVGMTPEELRIKNIDVRKFGMAKPFIELRNGVVKIQNSDYFLIQ